MKGKLEIRDIVYVFEKFIVLKIIIYIGIYIKI